jgi:hypothetical protein
MNTLSIKLVNSIVFITLLALFLTIYAPAIQHHFVTFADYVFIWSSHGKSAQQNSFISFMHSQPYEGRFLDNLYYYVTYNQYINPLKSISPANIVRLIGVLGIGLFAIVLYLSFRQFRFRASHAFLLSILICTLPPMWRYASILFVVHLIYSVLLAAVASLIIFKVFWKENAKSTNIFIAVIAAIALLFLSMNIYQPTAMVYWSMAIIPLLKTRNENFIVKWRTPIIIYFAVGFSAMAIYFVIIKAIYYMLSVGLQSRSGFISSQDIYNQLKWFVNIPLYFASNLWNVNKSSATSIFVLATISAGALSSIMRLLVQCQESANNLNIIWNAICRYSLIFTLIPLSYLPLLIVKFYDMQPYAYHRTLIGLEMVIVILLYWSILSIIHTLKPPSKFPEGLQNKVITVGLVIMALTTALISNYYIERYFARFSSDEIQFTKDIIKKHGLSKLSNDSKIQIISDSSHHIEAINKFTIFDLSHAISIVDVHGISLVRMSLNELGIFENIPIQFIRSDDYTLHGEGNTLIIDMRGFQKRTYNELNRPLTIQALLTHLRNL